MSNCSACGHPEDDPCMACRLQPAGYRAVKDVWLAHRPEDLPVSQNKEPATQWAIGSAPGGIAATWDNRLKRFVPTGQDVPLYFFK